MSEEKGKRRHGLRLLLSGLLLLAVMGLIFFMSAQDAADSGDMSRGVYNSWLGQLLDRILPKLIGQSGENSLRKYAHLFEYFLLGLSSFLFVYELFWVRRARLGKAMAVSFLWSVLYSCSDEWHQTFVPGRSGQLLDVCLDSIGIVCGIVFVSFFVLILQRRRKHASFAHRRENYGKAS